MDNYPSNILGNTAKSIHAGRNPASLRGFVKAKSIRYTLQRAAAGLLWNADQGKAQDFRVCHCGRSIQGTGVSVYRAADGSRARFGGLTTCGSGWTCPVCAQRIAEVRRDELSAAMVKHVASGGRAHLVTLTFPHDATWQLSDLMARFDKARAAWKNSRAYKRILGKEGAAGCIGAVSSLEITHGANGWHPHLHMLVFTRRSLAEDEIEELKSGFRPGRREGEIGGWMGQLLRVGLADRCDLANIREHSLDVRGGEDAAGYIAKYGREESWGLSSELTRTHAKEGNNGGLTPFGLLQRYTEGEAWAGAKFVEFARAFLGKRLLTWSPGLRKLFDFEEDTSDEDAAAAELPEEKHVARITPEQWKIVIERDARADLLEYAADACFDPDTSQRDVDEFIEYLAKLPKKSRGWFWQPMVRRIFH